MCEVDLEVGGHRNLMVAKAAGHRSLTAAMVVGHMSWTAVMVEVLQTD